MKMIIFHDTVMHPTHQKCTPGPTKCTPGRAKCTPPVTPGCIWYQNQRYFPKSTDPSGEIGTFRFFIPPADGHGNFGICRRFSRHFGAAAGGKEKNAVDHGKALLDIAEDIIYNRES